MDDDRVVPAAVSGRPDVRQALRRGDWPIVLRAFLDAGLSQSAIASATGLSQSQVFVRPADVRVWITGPEIAHD